MGPIFYFFLVEAPACLFWTLVFFTVVFAYVCWRDRRHASRVRKGAGRAG